MPLTCWTVLAHTWAFFVVLHRAYRTARPVGEAIALVEALKRRLRAVLLLGKGASKGGGKRPGGAPPRSIPSKKGATAGRRQMV